MPMSTVVPVLVDRDYITLFYPFASPTLSIDIRSPELGNQDRLNFTRIKQETRGGDTILFSESTWPKEHTLYWTFVMLLPAEKAQLLDFLSVTLGKEIGLIDYETHTWRGVILTPDSEITCDHRSTQCAIGRYTAVFEFQGVNTTWP